MKGVDGENMEIICQRK